MVKYLAQAEIEKRFGLPTVVDGHVTAAWEEANLVYIPLPERLALWNGVNFTSRIRCHKGIAKPLAGALEEIHSEGKWSYLREFLGCFNYRQMRTCKEMSRHSWGLAVDFKFVDWIPKEGEEPLVPLLQKELPPKEVIAIFLKHGFYWGGWFPKVDAMHFELGG